MQRPNNLNVNQDKAPFINSFGQHFELRQILLYFIRLSLHSLENLIFAYLQSSNKNTNKSHRKAVATAVDGFMDNKPIYEEAERSLSKRHHILFDFSTKPSTEILQALENKEKDKLFRFLRDEMRLNQLNSFDDFLNLIFLMRGYRSYLEHYHEYKRKQKYPTKSEADFFFELGRVLLPVFSGLLEGQLSRRHWRAGKDTPTYQLSEGRKARRQARTEYANSIKTRQKMDKGKRQKLHKENEIFRQKYQEWFPHEERHQAYRLQNFHDYFFMIGKEQLEALKNKSRANSFTELESIYKLHHDMNLKIAITIFYLEEKWIKEGAKDQNRFSKFIKKQPIYHTHQKDCNLLIKIRNRIAHGDLLFEHIDAKDIFSALLSIMKHENEKERANQLIFDLRHICKKARKMTIQRQTTIKRQDSEMQIWKTAMARSHWPKKDRIALSHLKNGNEPIKRIRHHGARHLASQWIEALNKVT